MKAKITPFFPPSRDFLGKRTRIAADQNSRSRSRQFVGFINSMGSPFTYNHQQRKQWTLQFPNRACIEFCFDVLHRWCSIHTSLRIWDPDMQPVGAIWVCALDLAMVWAQRVFCSFHSWPYLNATEGSCFGRVWSLIMQTEF